MIYKRKILTWPDIANGLERFTLANKMFQPPGGLVHCVGKLASCDLGEALGNVGRLGNGVNDSIRFISGHLIQDARDESPTKVSCWCHGCWCIGSETTSQVILYDFWNGKLCQCQALNPRYEGLSPTSSRHVVSVHIKHRWVWPHDKRCRVDVDRCIMHFLPEGVQTSDWQMSRCRLTPRIVFPAEVADGKVRSTRQLLGRD